MRLIPKPEQIGIEFGIPERSQREVIFDKIALERIRQDGKWGEQNHSPIEWIAILGEEFGEVSKEALELWFGRWETPEVYSAKVALYEKELIQVAAVAVSMLECLYRNN